MVDGLLEQVIQVPLTEDVEIIQNLRLQRLDDPLKGATLWTLRLGLSQSLDFVQRVPGCKSPCEKGLTHNNTRMDCLCMHKSANNSDGGNIRFRSLGHRDQLGEI